MDIIIVHLAFLKMNTFSLLIHLFTKGHEFHNFGKECFEVEYYNRALNFSKIHMIIEKSIFQELINIFHYIYISILVLS